MIIYCKPGILMYRGFHGGDYEEWNTGSYKSHMAQHPIRQHSSGMLIFSNALETCERRHVHKTGCHQ
jgi:hypothetical protein